ncbi:type VII secretion protein EccB [Jatrophihabitans sp. GAS493]|nr:type VII secretion protein EccB [Jatrophihabitans sp. GAS493]
MLSAQPDLPRTPLRRTPTGLAIGLVLALLVTGVVVLLGMLRPTTSPAWRKPGTLIVEKGTGSRFLFIGGTLHPVLNYASARLLIGAKMATAEAGSATLDRMPIGSPLGTPWAPDSLPPHQPTASSNWLTCLGPASIVDTGPRPVSLLLNPALSTRALPSDAAIVAAAPDGGKYLIEGGRRMRVTADWVLRALGADNTNAVNVRSAWLDTLPAGPDLVALPSDGAGAPGPTLDGHATAVGQVLVAQMGANGTHHYLVTSGGLMSISATAAELALGAPTAELAYRGQNAQPIEVSAPAVAAQPITPTPPQLSGMAAPPQFAAIDDADVPCVQTTSNGGTFQTTLVTAQVNQIEASGQTVQSSTALGLANTDRTADHVAVPPNDGLLARTTPVPGDSSGSMFLVTSMGAKYPIANDDAAVALGYAAADVVPVPPEILDLLPTGPRLARPEGGGA